VQASKQIKFIKSLNVTHQKIGIEEDEKLICYLIEKLIFDIFYENQSITLFTIKSRDNSL
jgi:hypothetical protein